MSWQFVQLLPTEMLQPNQLVSKSIANNKISIAGSVGKKVNKIRKPGINEDGGLVAVSDNVNVYLLIDGHYERDATEIMIDTLRNELENGNWDEITHLDNHIECPKLLKNCLIYCDILHDTFQEEMVEGEASFMLLIHIKEWNRLYYFSVGDLMLFHQDPTRSWGMSYQIHTRMFYEWINRDLLMGYHFGEVRVPKNSKILLATDGLMDQPTFSHNEISNLFTLDPFHAETYVKHALQHTPIEEDDNVSVICIIIE